MDMAPVSPQRDRRDRPDNSQSVPLSSAMPDRLERDGTGQPSLEGVLSVPPPAFLAAEQAGPIGRRATP